MASSVGATMTQSKPPKRTMPIIPAIPRKLEKRIPQIVNVSATAKAEVEQSSNDFQNHDQHVRGETNLCLVDLESAIDGASELLTGTSETIQSPAEGSAVILHRELTLPANLTSDSNVRTSLTSQDCGIEKHAFELPPPFYPAHTQPAYSSTAPSEQVELTHSSLPLPDTGVGDEGDVTQEQAVSNSSSPLSTQQSSPHQNSHSDPLDNVAISTNRSSYQGYVQVQHTPLYPQPTPPTEASNSPTQSAYLDHGHVRSISFYPPPNSSFDGTFSPTQSSYQGYAYHTYPNCRTLPYSSDSTQQQADNTLPFRTEYGPGLPYYSQAPAFSSMGSHPPLTPSATPLNSSTKESPDGLSGFQPSLKDSESTPSTLPDHLESPCRTTSESTVGFEDTSSSSNKSKIYSPNVISMRDHAFEIWRTTTLEALQRVCLDRSSTQPSFSTYVLERFSASDSYTDCCLQIRHKTDRFQSTDFWLHSFLIAQSPTLRALLEDSIAGADGKRFLCLEARDRYSTLPAIKRALRVCYGDSPLNFTGSAAHIEPSKSATEVSVCWMDNAIAFAAAGYLLQLNSVIARALQVASAVLNWDNLERALSLGLSYDFDLTSDYKSSNLPSANSDGVIPPSPNARPLTRFTPPFLMLGSMVNLNGELTSTDAFKDLLYRCLDFILSNCPRSWNLHVSARPLADCNRLPTTAESRSPISKSRLSRIQFGDHPSENATSSSDPNVILSSILLSLPFAVLQYILDHFEEPIKRRNIGSIVAERERRRQRVLGSESISSIQKEATAEEWVEAGWKEFVPAEGASDHSIARVWTGF